MLTQNLSQKQIEAVTAIDDDVEIIACAGAGKTGVVTRRIINILKTKPEISPENIVAFTFTKKSCGRVEKSYLHYRTIYSWQYSRFRKYVHWNYTWILLEYASRIPSRIPAFFRS